MVSSFFFKGWGRDSFRKCTLSTKQKAMYGTIEFQPSIMTKKMTSIEVAVEWNALKFHPVQNWKKKGGVYVAYTVGMKDGSGGYFGVQIRKSGGNHYNNILLTSTLKVSYLSIFRGTFTFCLLKKSNHIHMHLHMEKLSNEFRILSLPYNTFAIKALYQSINLRMS